MCIRDRFGRYSRIANDLIATSDYLFVVGCKLGEVATRRYDLLATGAPIIHLDIVAEEFDRTTTPTLRQGWNPMPLRLRAFCTRQSTMR